MYEVSTPCIDDHQWKIEEMEAMGELPNVCSQIVLKRLDLSRIGRPDIPWCVRLLSNLPKMHLLVAYRQICYFVVCSRNGPELVTEAWPV